LVTQKLCAEFASAGHEVKVLTSHMRGLSRREVQGGVEIIRAPALRRRKDRSCYLQMGAYLAGALPGFLRIMHSWKPDVVHSHFLMPTSFLAYLGKKFFGVPYVITLHGYDVPSFVPEQTGLYKYVMPFARAFGKDCACMVAVSRSLEEAALTDFPEMQGKTRYIPNGMDPQPDGQRGQKDVPSFLVCCRLAVQKNIEMLLMALRDVKHDYMLTILGDGPLREKLEEMAGQCARSDCIEFKGWVDREEVDEYMRSAHFLVTPSRKEGMSMSILQAYANGLPVIGTRVPGIEEYVSPEETGFLVESNDAQELGELLERLCLDVSCTDTFRDNCREYVKSFYWPVIARSYMLLFAEITGCKTQPEEVESPATPLSESNVEWS